MDLRGLIAQLPGKKGSVFTFERGQVASHPHAKLHDDIKAARRVLESWGVRPGMRVGIYAPNSYAWMVHDLALIDLGAVSVPFTDDFAGQVNDELLARYDVALLLISKSHAKQFAQKPAHVAFLDAESGAVQALDRMPPAEADGHDHHSLVFSSGSAGGLKGLVISRKGIEGTLPPIYDTIGIRSGDRVQLFLPLSNLQQRNMCYAALWYDFDLIITDYTQLFAAMKALHPTILIGPPVVYQMIEADFERLTANRKRLCAALAWLIALVPVASWRMALARRAFPDFHGQFGGRMRMLITGMAPIRRELGRFFERMQLPLCETYGMVEAGSITFRPAGSRQYGSVGKVLPGIALSFEEDGEIVVQRDHHLTLRYFQCAEGENERTFLSKDKVATGDIGRLDGDGNLFLMGRKRELIVAPGGYKVHPEVIEQEINHCPDVDQSVIFLKPNSTQLTAVVALVQPETEGARARVKKHVAGLKSARKVASYVEVIFADGPFTRENGGLRPNLKLDRKAIAAKYS